MKITKQIPIEELVEILPAAVRYLSKQGITCIMCGEPIWGTLDEVAQSKGFSDADVEKFVKELNDLKQEQTA